MQSRRDGKDCVQLNDFFAAGDGPGSRRGLHDRHTGDDVIAVKFHLLVARAGAALQGGLVVPDPQEGFGFVGDEVAPGYPGWSFNPGPPVGVGTAGLFQQVGRRLDQDEDHVDFVGVAAGDHVVCGVVGEGQAPIGFDDVRLDRVSVARVDVIPVVFHLELDGDPARIGHGLARNQRGRPSA